MSIGQQYIEPIAMVRAIGQQHRPATVSVVRDSVTCACGHESTLHDGLEEHRATLIVEWLMNQHAAMLDALTRHGVLGERFAIQDERGDIWLDCHGDDEEAVAMGQEYASRQAIERIVARPHEDVVRRLVTAWEVTP